MVTTIADVGWTGALSLEGSRRLFWYSFERDVYVRLVNKVTWRLGAIEDDDDVEPVYSLCCGRAALWDFAYDVYDPEFYTEMLFLTDHDWQLIQQGFYEFDYKGPNQ